MAPTDRSMPPPPMTNVIPTLTTPMTEASRRMVIALSTLAKRSPAVMTPTMHSSSRAMTRPRLRPAEPAMSDATREAAWRSRLGGQRRGVARRPDRQVVGHRRAALGVRGLLGRPDTHAASPLMMMSSTWCSSSWSAWASCSTSPSPDHEDAVGQAEHLLDLAGHDDDGDPVVGEPADEGVDLGAGADVDTAGGLVEQEDPAAAAAASGPGRPSAGCRRTGCAPRGRPRGADVEALDLLASRPAARRRGRACRRARSG